MKSAFKALIVVMMAMIPALSSAAQQSVPQVIGFHSAMRDEGGNPIADGERGVAFRIKDAEGVTVYEESQRVTAVGGQLSALIGNGLDANGAPTGGVPSEAIYPSGGRYLEVEVEGHSPISGMELASVPYCSFSQVALSAAEGSVSFEALASGAVDEIARQLTGGVGSEAIVLREELDTIYSDPSSAQHIGIESSGLTNSASQDVQGVLGDLDGAIAANSQNIVAGDSQRIMRTGDSMSGDLTMNANVIMADGRTVDGYDVGEEFKVLNARTAGFGRVIWGSVTGGSVPSIVGPNVSVSSCGASCYDIGFVSPMPTSSYALVMTPMDSRKSSDQSVSAPHIITQKTASGFRVQFNMLGAQNFDFMAVGL